MPVISVMPLMALSRLPLATRRLLLALLALVLLHAQGLGQWHRVAHAGLPAEHASAAAHDPFGHPADDQAECRLFDHLGAADSLLPTPAALCLDAAALPGVAALPAGLAGRTSPVYLARGPPRA